MSEDHQGLLTLCAAVLLDGLDQASKQLIVYMRRHLAIKKARKDKKAIPERLPVYGDLYWVMSDSKEKMTFSWYCDLLNLDKSVLRRILINSVSDYIHHNKPLHVFRKKSFNNVMSSGNAGIADVGE
jgi:hypothetical protein